MCLYGCVGCGDVENVGSGIGWVLLLSALLWDRGVFLPIVRHRFIFQTLRQLKQLETLCDFLKINGREFLKYYGNGLTGLNK